MHRVFISDLHLSPDHPRLVRGFVDLVQECIRRQVNELYIMGDWFEAWVGDDDDALWLCEVIEPLQHFQQAGGRILVFHGNRDFLIGNAFVRQFGAELVPDTLIISTEAGTLRLEHGDALCTDDTTYQAFRSLSRQPEWQQGMLSQPLEQRKQIAQMMRLQSQMKQANTAANIMDVNTEAVEQAVGEADMVLHGHTHRPDTHVLANHKKRMVLGDWREESGEAVIIRQQGSQIQPEVWRF